MSRSGPIAINLPCDLGSNWKTELTDSIKLLKFKPKCIDLNCNNWSLGCKEFIYIENFCTNMGAKINIIYSNIPETIVSASALGFTAILNNNKTSQIDSSTIYTNHIEEEFPNLLFKKGTLRSGEILEAEGNILLLGHVNPGAKISAVGDILVWGRLLGVAHAGTKGDRKSKIIALQLRPLQLRIAEKVARGPLEKPEEGLAEEALLEFNEILIRPARSDSFRNLRT